MKCDICGGPVEKQEVIYSVEINGRLALVENVPAKVCLQCGEKLFSAETVERLQKTAWGQKAPTRVMETAVFDFTS